VSITSQEFQKSELDIVNGEKTVGDMLDESHD